MRKMILALALLLVFETRAKAEAVPSLINYQGRLTASDGTPLNGNFSLLFTLYDDPITGVTLWQESKVVAVANGKFSHLLGSNIPITSAVFQTPNVHLGLRVNGDLEMTPRSRIASVGYALKSQDSDTVDGLHANEISAGGTVTPVVLYFLHGPGNGSFSDCKLLAVVPTNARLAITFEALSPNIGNGKFYSNAVCTSPSNVLADPLNKSSVGLSFPGGQSIYWKGLRTGSIDGPVTIGAELRY